MQYMQTNPCADCPFLEKHRSGYTLRRLAALASGEFPCHKTAEVNEDTGTFEEAENSVHCAGALIFNEKRDKPHQMMRICERLGLYDRSKLNMKAKVR